MAGRKTPRKRDPNVVKEDIHVRSSDHVYIRRVIETLHQYGPTEVMRREAPLLGLIPASQLNENQRKSMMQVKRGETLAEVAVTLTNRRTGKLGVGKERVHQLLHEVVLILIDVLRRKKEVDIALALGDAEALSGKLV